MRGAKSLILSGFFAAKKHENSKGIFIDAFWIYTDLNSRVLTLHKKLAYSKKNYTSFFKRRTKIAENSKRESRQNGSLVKILLKCLLFLTGGRCHDER